MPFTSGFDPAELPDHFTKHGAEFGAATAQIYEQMADIFFGGPTPATTHECVRSRGDVVRYDTGTDEFGVVDRNGIIRTYFKPDPRRHHKPTNYDYFLAECQRF